MRARALILALTVLPAASALTACNSKQKTCEHTRDVFIEQAQVMVHRALAGAPEGAKERLQKKADEELQAANAAVVPRCMEASEEDIKCFARIDEMVANEDPNDPCALALERLRDKVYADADE